MLKGNARLAESDHPANANAFFNRAAMPMGSAPCRNIAGHDRGTANAMSSPANRFRLLARWTPGLEDGMTKKDLVGDKYDAQIREADARLDALQAEAEARHAKEDMEEISGLRDAKERARQKLADLKTDASQGFESAKRSFERSVDDLEVGINKLSERYSAWDSARERRFNARLDEAESKLRAWKARLDVRQAERGMRRRDDLARLEEQTALARARAAELSHDRHNRKAQEALDDAARHFDQAFDAAAKRYEE
jgi:hypothetical protein